MPGQQRSVGPRTRGSWLPVLAGLGAIVLLAGIGSLAYVAEFHPGQHSASSPPSSRVASFQTVGLVAQQPAPDGSVVQLLGSGNHVVFSPVSNAGQQEGSPEWTADLMVGGTYIFIYLPTSQCLASAGSGARSVLTVTHCDLAARQRWRRLGSGVVAGGHYFYEFANDANGKCITQATSGQQVRPGLAACDQSQPAAEMLSFWWSTT
jgi:hypothetical protein